MRGNQNPRPSHPSADGHVPALPQPQNRVALTPPRTTPTSTTPSSPPPRPTVSPALSISTDHLCTFQAAIDSLYDRNDALHTQYEELHHPINSIARSQAFMAQQNAAFQNVLLNHWGASPPPPFSPTAVPVSTPSKTLGFPIYHHQPQPMAAATPPTPSLLPLSFGTYTHLPTTPPLATPHNTQVMFTLSPSSSAHPLQMGTPHVSLPSTSHRRPPYQPPPPSPPPNFPPYQPADQPPLPPPHLQHPDHSYRPPKVELPRFNGDDVDTTVWVNAFELRHPHATWDEFVAALTARFGAGTISDIKGALSHLKQTSSVDEFISAFPKLSCRAPDWPNSELIHMFIVGLRSELRHDIRALNPHTIEEAQRLARLFEARNLELRSPPPFRRPNPPSTYNKPQFPSSSSHTNPNSLPRPPPPNNNPFPHYTPRPNNFRTLSPVEQRDRRAKGLCFGCDEAWHDKHVCKQPLLSILAPESEEALVEDTLPPSPPLESAEETTPSIHSMLSPLPS
ncbi:uncharacterized protein LOC126792123 [Argentina anserina]|uniref:uncharacterized protein LOC126792123 n=1 Tax=Argentina anserina TaxID=57926 RepID=UPI002176606E|nr:uncharacterized protein LOC126792123 [Potentilla anserina]